MQTNPKWQLSEKTKAELIDALTPELAALRTKADISQGELASLIGVSRQTYGAIERQSRRMTWNTYLSLVLFFAQNKETRKVLYAVGAVPETIARRINEGLLQDLTEVLGEDIAQLLECLDEKALHSIRTMIMVEYARCTQTPGDVVLKSFEGKTYTSQTPAAAEGRKALKTIKQRQHSHGK